MTDLHALPPSLDLALEAALRDAILSDPLLGATLNGVHDSAPTQAHAPFIRIGDALVSNWSAKGFAGQDVRLAITIHDEQRSRERAARLADALSAAIDAMNGAIEGGRIVLKQMQRMRAGRTAGTGWLIVTDWRFLLERVESF